MKLIETLIDRPREERDLELIEQRLRQIATVMRATLLALEYEFREDSMADSDNPSERAKAFVELEKRELAKVPRRPSREEEREARMSLGLTLPAWDENREDRMVEERPRSLPIEASDRQERA